MLHGEDPVGWLRLRLTVAVSAGSGAGRPLIRLADLTGPDAPEVGAAVRAYLLQTEREKSQQEGGSEPDPSGALPERYRCEVDDPSAAYAGHRVRVAQLGESVVGVVVLSVSDDVAEIKRLWAVPEVRGRGVGSALLDAALHDARDLGTARVRLSVWDWRTGPVRLYESRGFQRVPSWDDRERLVCMELSHTAG
ncbi:Mycothiol acetyltransferase [Microbacterium oxydans]|uniref:Mycothiol acetyltransferase n=1 Tax=Microbacterium oxydans TaxID=82380 RepID=A0A0F0KQ37_9MICO|nr:GNAT family N-acetyltransferase [Microbacterium oxydans]KJL22574.1 Mycothiol acetyltransferase [Microbacterium oxydans]